MTNLRQGSKRAWYHLHGGLYHGVKERQWFRFQGIQSVLVSTWEFTFTSPSRLSKGREGGFVSFFWVWSKKTKQPRLESSPSPLDPTEIPLDSPSPPNFLHGAVVKS